MRNDIGISHPNNYTINAYELLGWLQTCVQDVLRDQPTEAALQVQAFIGNLKTYTDPLDPATTKTIEARISELPTHFCGNILRTVFGIFVAPDTHAIVRKNISIIAPHLWNTCGTEPKHKLGVVLEGYKANLHREKYILGEQFFETVGGNAFRSNSERLIIVNELLIELMNKHNGWDNFHHEVPVVKSLSTYISDQNSIIPNIVENLFKTILLCRIGRGLAYNNGVSPGGKRYYDALLSFAGDQYAPTVMALLSHYEIKNKLHNKICREQAKAALVSAKINVINQRLVECLDFLIANIEASSSCVNSVEFKRLSADYIN